jgi:hypothetical protein
MVDFITDSTHQSKPALGQQVTVLANSAATQTAYSPKIGAPTKTITITIANVTAVGVGAGGTVVVWGSNDPLVATSNSNTNAIWSQITSVVASATTVASQSFFHTADTNPWLFYRVTTGANASTNTNTVTVSF